MAPQRAVQSSRVKGNTRSFRPDGLSFAPQRAFASSLSYPKSFSPESSWGGDAYLDRKRLKTFFAVRDKLQFMEAFEEMKVGGKVDKNICNLALKFCVHIEDKGLAETLFAYMESEGVPGRVNVSDAAATKAISVSCSRQAPSGGNGGSPLSE